MHKASLTLAIVPLATVALALPAASAANDTQLGHAYCPWNTASTQAIGMFPRGQGSLATNNLKFSAKDRTQIVKVAKKIESLDATVKRVFLHTSGSTAAGRKMRTDLLKVVGLADKAAAQLIAAATKNSPQKITLALANLTASQTPLTQGAPVGGDFVWMAKACTP